MSLRRRNFSGCRFISVMSMLYTADGRALWLAKDFRTAGLYDPPTLKLFLPLPTGMLPLALSPNGRRLAVSVDTRQLQVWDLEEVRTQLRKLGMDWDEEPPPARSTG